MAFPTLPLTASTPSDDLSQLQRISQKELEGGGMSVMVFPVDHTLHIVLRPAAIVCYTGVSNSVLCSRLASSLQEGHLFSTASNSAPACGMKADHGLRRIPGDYNFYTHQAFFFLPGPVNKPRLSYHDLVPVPRPRMSLEL